jgi:hypothetical protein
MMIDHKQSAKTPRAHADLIKAWADGATIEVMCYEGHWRELKNEAPMWCPDHVYRIKPTPRVHKWQKIIDAHAAGQVIQYRFRSGRGWTPWKHLGLGALRYPLPETDNWEYRIKPEEVVFDVQAEVALIGDCDRPGVEVYSFAKDKNLRLTFEGGELISALVLR